MTKFIRVLGSPGTGKTTYLYNKALKNSNTGLYVTYNVSMAKHAKEIFPYSYSVGTMHSICYNLIRNQLGFDNMDMLSKSDIMRWFRNNGIEGDFDIDADEGVSGYSIGSSILQEFDRYRHSYTELRRVEGYDGDIMSLFDDYIRFKGTKYDFTDFLIKTLINGLTPSYDYIYVDEAQDLTRLMWDIIDAWAQNAKEVYVAGDEYQLIYRIRGVGDDFVSRKYDETVVLDTSFRSKRNIYSIYNAISSMITDGIPRDIKVSDGGEVMNKSIYDSLRYMRSNMMTDKSIFYLARTRYSISGFDMRDIKGVADMMIDEGIPFKTINPRHSGFTPWTEDFIDYANNIIDMTNGGYITGSSLKKLIDRLPTEHKGMGLTVKRGVKTSIKKALSDSSLLDFSNIGKYFNGDINIHNLIVNGAFTDRQKNAFINYFGQSLRQDMKITEHLPTQDKINISIDTIHSAKGREADIVIIDTGITSKIKGTLMYGSDEEKNDEYRVWYVATSRAKDEIVFTNSHVLSLTIEPFMEHII